MLPHCQCYNGSFEKENFKIYKKIFESNSGNMWIGWRKCKFP